jgi:hypothetical protein
MQKIISTLFVLGLVQACSHPLEIIGQGDIVDLNESGHGCTLEQFEAGDKACKKNQVIKAYDVNYSAQPRDGYQFVRWDGPCSGKSVYPDCAMKVAASLVKQFHFKKMPATRAVFCPKDGLLYSQDFEDMTPGLGYPPNDLADDNWVVFGAVFAVNPYTNPDATPTSGYGPFEAADGDPGTFQGIATDEGGRGQGSQHLNKYTDYNNPSQATSFIEGITLQQHTVTAEDVGTWTLAFEAKRKAPENFGIGGQSSAYAFIKTLDPDDFFEKGNVRIDMTQAGKIEKWARYSITLEITQDMVGDILQFGFSATAFNYEPSGIYYDNIFFGTCTALSVGR